MADNLEPPLDKSNDDSNSAFNSGIIRKTEYFDLFISYKRDNGGDHGQKLAEELYHKLSADGYKVWLDNEEIGFSSDFEKRLEEAILHSKKVACVMSPAWVESENCRYEHKKAVEFEKRLIPIHYQEFRGLLREKKDEDLLTDYEWRKLDKPQEVDFSSSDKFDRAYQDLKAVCNLKDDVTAHHTKVLTESYYWDSFSHPKSMLRTGDELSKMRILKSKCDGDAELPSFTEVQNKFLEASQEYVSSSVSNRRAVFITYKKGDLNYATDLNMELRLNNVSTFFHEDLHDIKETNLIQDEIIKSDNFINVISEKDPDVDDEFTKFAESKSKRILDVSYSKDRVTKMKSDGGKNIFFWNDQTRIDGLISTINGDKAYNLMHTKLLSASFEWENSGKSDSNLLGAKDAATYQEWYKNAEELGTEPQPNIGMISFVERSLTYVDALRRRRRFLVWSITAGILLLLAATIIAFILKGDLDESVEAEKKATIAKNNADKAAIKSAEAEKKAESEKNAAEQQKDLAEKASLKSAADKKRAEEAAVKAKLEMIAAQAEAERARSDAKKTRDEADEVIKEANYARTSAEARVREADEAVAIAQFKSDSIEKVSRDAMQMTDARVAASKALEYIQARETDQAKVKAKESFDLVTDPKTNTTKAIQNLYDAYCQLLDDESILGTGPNHDGEDLSKVEDKLNANKSIVNNTYPSLSTTFIHQQKMIPAYYGNSFSKQKDIQKVLNKLSSRNVSAMCVSPHDSIIAIGFDDGKIETWNLNKTSFIADIKGQSYRITSIAFSPDAKTIAITGIYESFNLVPMLLNGKKDEGRGDVITKDNKSRIERLYFYNDDILVAVSWNNISTVWAANIGILTEEVK